MPSISSRQSLESASINYHAALFETPDAARYLASRGLTKETAQHFRLGFVANPAPGHEDYLGRLAIPYLTQAGVVTMRFRVMPTGHGPKYLSLPNDPPRLFNVAALFQSQDYIAVCEGEFDAIAVETLAGVPAVGVPGVNGWRSNWGQLFRGYSRVFVVKDADFPNETTGDRPGEKLFAAVVKAVREAVPINLPEGHDANSFLLEFGPDALLEKMGLA